MPPIEEASAGSWASLKPAYEVFDMGLGDDLKSEVLKILQERWTEREGRVVPESDNLKLSNDAVTLDGTVWC